MPVATGPEVTAITHAPEVLGRFELLDRRGSGSFGTVWKVRDTELGRVVALKLLHQGLVSREEDRSRFFREARAAARLNHPGIVGVHEVLEIDGCPAIVSEYVEGMTLREWAQTEKPNFVAIAEVIVQVAEALDYASLMGLVHRDIKPDNIMIRTGTGGHPQAMIVDFGLALQDEIGGTLTIEGQLIGTPAYMSPEQAAGRGHQADGRSDIYSLGVVLFELIAGEPPFHGPGMSVVHQVIRDEPRAPRSVNKTIPRDLETVCLKAMAKRPGDRYESGRELADDLRRWLRGETVLARPVGAFERTVRWARRNPVLAILLSVVITLLSIIAIGGSLTTSRLQDAHRATLENLREAYLARARAQRMGSEAGRRFSSLEQIAKAARIRPGLDLRNEAIACMPIVDLKLKRTVEARAPAGEQMFLVDPTLDRYVALDSGLVHCCIRRVLDGSTIQKVPLRFGGGYAGSFCSADGRFLELAGDTIRIWDLTHATLVHQWPGPWFGHYWVTPDARRACVPAGAKGITLFDLTTRSEVLRVDLPARADIACFDPSGRRVALHLQDRRPIQIADLETGAITKTISPGNRNPFGWSPDGRRLALGRENDVEIWDVQTGELVQVLRGHTNQIVAAEFRPGGDLLASTAWDGTTRIWDPASAQELIKVDGDFSGWSADGRRMATIQSPSGRIWDVASGEEMRTFRVSPDAEHGPWSCALHPGGRILAGSFDDGVHLWDLQLGRELAVLPAGNSREIEFVQEGRALLTVGTKGAIRWPIDPDPTGACLYVGPPEVLMPPTGRFRYEASLGPGERLLAPSRGDTAVVIPLHGASRYLTLAPHRGVSWMAMSPDARWIVTGSQHAPGVKVWDAVAGSLILDLPGESDGKGIFDPEGNWLLTSAKGSGTNILSVGTWKSFHLDSRRCSAMAFSPDGRMLALGPDSDFGQTLLIDPATREVLARLSPPSPAPIGDFCFSADMGTLVVACYNQLVFQVWDLRRIREELREMGLDWEPPLPPTQDKASEPAGIIRVQVVAGSSRASHER